MHGVDNMQPTREQIAKKLDTLKERGDKQIATLQKSVDIQSKLLDNILMRLDAMGVVVKDIDDNTHKLDRMEGLLDELDNRL